MEFTDTTAVRSDINEAKGTATLTVTFPDGRRFTTTGKAAYRAAAAVVCRRDDLDHLGVYGVRGDLMKAQAEAERMRTQTRRRMPSQFRGQPARYHEVTPWPVAFAVEVTDA